jgi:hypothetical protein
MSVSAGGPGFPYKVSADDPEIFSVTAHVTAGYARWYLDLSWSCNGREGTHRIDIDGEPIRTVGLEDDR